MGAKHLDIGTAHVKSSGIEIGLTNNFLDVEKKVIDLDDKIKSIKSNMDMVSLIQGEMHDEMERSFNRVYERLIGIDGDINVLDQDVVRIKNTIKYINEVHKEFDKEISSIKVKMKVGAFFIIVNIIISLISIIMQF